MEFRGNLIFIRVGLVSRLGVNKTFDGSDPDENWGLYLGCRELN
jgi:hypothetical protein